MSDRLDNIEKSLIQIQHSLSLLLSEVGKGNLKKRRRKAVVIPDPQNVTEEEREKVRELARKKGINL
jgi:hypothetical protein